MEITQIFNILLILEHISPISIIELICLEEMLLKALKFLSVISALCLLQNSISYAKTYDSDFGDEIRKDRKKLFYRICMDAYRDIPKRGGDLLCPIYASNVQGEDFKSIFESMQLEFKNMARRNKHLPRVILTEKHTKNEFKKVLEDKDPKYKQIFFPDEVISGTSSNQDSKPSAKIPRIIPVKVIDLSENDLNTGNSYVQGKVDDVVNRPNTSKVNVSNAKDSSDDADDKEKLDSRIQTVENEDDSVGNSEVADNSLKQPVEISPRTVSEEKTEVANQPVKPDVKAPVDSGNEVVNKPVHYSDEKVREIYNDSLMTGLKYVCVDQLKKKNGKLKDEDYTYCDSFVSKQKDKSISQILDALKNDPRINGSISEAVLKKLIITVAIRNGYDDKQLTSFVYNHGGDIKKLDIANVADEGSKERSPAVIGEAVVNESNTPDIEKTLTDAYATILANEIAKNCSAEDTKCIEDITNKINSQRDAALANLGIKSSLENRKPATVEVASPEEDVSIQVAPLSTVTTPPISEVNCEDQIQQGIRELLQKDENNILGKQFQLTSLKMALQIMENRSKKSYDNVEDFIQNDQKKLLARDNKKVLEDLVTFYRDYGKVKDDDFIDKTFNKVVGSHYFKSSTRIYNESASVMILADSLTNENSRFNEIDAASVWFSSEINKKFKQGTYHKNLTNLSSLTYRVLGKLKNEKPPINIEKLRLGIDTIEKDLSGNYEIMRNEIGEKFSDCFKGENASCNAKPAFDKNFAKSLMELTSKIKNSDNFSIEVDKSLKGSINGEFKFDFLPGQYK